MIFFRVSQNINIKTTDGSLVKYFKFKEPSNLNNETVYITTADDFQDLNEVFNNVDANKYQTRLLKEDRVRSVENFPIELGISNENEYLRDLSYQESIDDSFTSDIDEVNTFVQSSNQVDLFTQLKVKKDDISVAIIGSVGKTIGEMVASSTALRILYNKLKSVYKTVRFDLFIDASNNTFYSRDKDIYSKQTFINKVCPLSLNSRRLCSYDYFIDNSSVIDKSSYYKELNFVDAWLYKFGIDYKKIPNEEKYNHLDLSNFEPSESLKEKIETAKLKGKLLLFHPYTANIEKSIPQEYAISILKKLVKKVDDYTIVTTINIDGKNKNFDVIDFSKESNSFNDFTYIISNMDAIITAQTATFHISDAFMIPTVAIFTKPEIEKKTKYYNFVKAIEIEDKSKNFSNFIFDNDALTFYKFESWEKLKVSKIMKLLESF